MTVSTIQEYIDPFGLENRRCRAGLRNYRWVAALFEPRRLQYHFWHGLGLPVLQVGTLATRRAQELYRWTCFEDKIRWSKTSEVHAFHLPLIAALFGITQTIKTETLIVQTKYVTQSNTNNLLISS